MMDDCCKTFPDRSFSSDCKMKLKTVWTTWIKNKRYLFTALKYFVWTVALLSMLGLTVRDCLNLIFQYQENKVVANVALIDGSQEGIRIPNGTVCIQTNLLKHTFAGLLDPKFRGTFEDLMKLKVADYTTTQMNEHFSERYNNTWSKVVNDSVPENMENFNNVQTLLAFRLCRLMNVQLKLTDGLTMKKFDICNFVQEGTLPFTVNTLDILCFRIPLDLVVFKDKFLESTNNDSSYTVDDEGDVKSNTYSKQILLLKFSPLALRTALHQDGHPPNEITIMTFLPEVPMTYGEISWDNLINLGSKGPFRHNTIYPWDFTYGKSTTFDVRLSVDAKFAKLTNNPGCTDIYNRTTCIGECLEEDFSTLCDCNRFTFSQFFNTNGTTSNKHYCTRKRYSQCSTRDEQFHIFGESKYAQKTMAKCLDKCQICSTIDLDEVNQFDLFKLKSDKSFSEKFCQIYNTFSHADSNESCKKRLETEENARNMSDEIMFKNLSLSVIDKDIIFGNIVYSFGMKSFTYPEFSETELITQEGFLSQIGGIFGLYLGVSGLTFFALVINILKYMKRKWKRKEEERRLSMALSVSKFWYIFSQPKRDSTATVIEDINYNDPITKL